ncbi:MAG: hypothetical protein K2O69_07615 [Odoribacter sp.]|nr:hypothetical protein [Odoribacter sp.]
MTNRPAFPASLERVVGVRGKKDRQLREQSPAQELLPKDVAIFTGEV